MVDYCAKNNVLPEIQMIKAQEITQAWKMLKIKMTVFYNRNF